MKAQTSKARPPTPAEINAQQKADAERASKAASAVANTQVPSVPDSGVASTKLPSVPDSGVDFVQRYLDDVAPASIVGRMIKFNGKEGQFTTADDGEAVSEETVFAALCDQTLVG